MPKLWLTYAWEDNRDRDVDFIAQELTAIGIDVRLDRWTIGAGRRLWEQIASFITDSDQSDAWMLYATQNSVARESCREELALALDRAINSREEAFPIIALFPSTFDRDLMPPNLRVRLGVSLAEPEWKERIVAALERRSLAITRPELTPYVMTVHPARPSYPVVLEVRPRAGVWFPFAAAIPVAEREQLGLQVRSGPRGQVPPTDGLVMRRGTSISDDGQWFLEYGWDAASPTLSYYLYFLLMPARFSFGQADTNGEMYIWEGVDRGGV